ncbi:FMN-binding protein [Muriicola sp. Z0-33]|uniref:FMN-binding protein n=1 Tax=Muriicola sp. Z0-33 TaxID=2816957 RepID=UPI0022380DB7|nr:FMN-binding protein [Muriicola sp. Z0-33]MCW5517985.1 FMN-binding protein [Muriicola sp. Z0-33]
MRQVPHLNMYILAFGMLFLTLWNCKEKPVPKATVEKAEMVQTISKTIKEIAIFADLSLTDTTDITTLMSFKEIDENGMLTESDAQKTEQLFKALTKVKPLASFPVVEIKNTTLVILVTKGKGFAGGIWAKILIDRASGKVQKIQFDHIAESEGYGSGITRKSFEDQFIGMPAYMEPNTLSLIQDGKVIGEGIYKIDGIAGATATSKGVIDMLHQGLENYQNYLRP